MSKYLKKPQEGFSNPYRGREIYRDGKPFVRVERVGDTKPVEADEVGWLISELLNKFFKTKRAK